MIYVLSAWMADLVGQTAASFDVLKRSLACTGVSCSVKQVMSEPFQPFAAMYLEIVIMTGSLSRRAWTSRLSICSLRNCSKCGISSLWRSFSHLNCQLVGLPVGGWVAHSQGTYALA
jgi:hypothetical protein